jgi:hypothetical protein
MQGAIKHQAIQSLFKKKKKKNKIKLQSAKNYESIHNHPCL